MTSILVTGGAGYIGSHVCKALAAAGFTPVTYDDLGRGHAWAVRWGPLERGDVADGERVSEVIARHRPAAAIHLAGFGYVGESNADPALYYRNNVAGSLGLLQACVAGGLQRIVFSSSCSTYGVAPPRPITEDQPQQPISPYGFTKLAVERMLLDLRQAHGLAPLALRYFNAAGADPDGELGEEHEPEPHILPTLLRAAAGDGAVTLNGHDYDTPDGTVVRDFIHVSDLADAHVLAVRRLLGGGVPRFAYNLGNGSGHSLRQCVDVVGRVTGRPLRVTLGPRRPGDPPFAVGDATLARRELGWSPRLGDLTHIVRTAWDWMTRHRGKFVK